MQKKDDKVGNKTANKEERQRERKRRAKGEDRNRFAKKKRPISQKKMPFSAKLIFSHSYPN